MEDVYGKLVELYEPKKQIKIVLKEPKILIPFCGRVKTNKRYNEMGELVGYTLTRKPKKEYKLFLYKSTNGTICLSNKASRVRSVYPPYVLFNDSDVESIEVVKKVNKNINWDVKNRDYILNNLHENMWDNIKNELKLDNFNEKSYIRENSGRKIKTVSIKSIFPKWVLDAVKDAIENKKDFRYAINGVKRDKSISIKLGEDGILRGWYSSEFSGYGNGAYYLLINPNTAIFAEYD